jgi:hypothetical protein
MSFSCSRKSKYYNEEQLPPYRPVTDKSFSYTYTFDVPSPGTVTINAKGDSSLKVSHVLIPTALPSKTTSSPTHLSQDLSVKNTESLENVSSKALVKI